MRANISTNSYLQRELPELFTCDLSLVELAIFQFTPKSLKENELSNTLH